VELAGALLKSLDREYRAFVDPADVGPAALSRSDSKLDLIRRFEDASSTARDCRVHVEESGGYDGVTNGLDDRGFLRVKTESGVKIVLSGGVRPLNA